MFIKIQFMYQFKRRRQALSLHILEAVTQLQVLRRRAYVPIIGKRQLSKKNHSAGKTKRP